jgi:hypothetical protein
MKSAFQGKKHFLISLTLNAKPKPQLSKIEVKELESAESFMKKSPFIFYQLSLPVKVEHLPNLIDHDSQT